MSSGIGKLPRRGLIPLSVVDALPIPLLVSRFEDDVIVHVNSEFSATYGYGSAEAAGLPCRDLHFVHDDRDKTLEAHASGGIRSVEVRLQPKGGGCLWAQADVARFELDGADVLLTTFHDIGEMKEAQSQVAEMALFPEMNPGPVMSLDLDGSVRRSNASARSALGEDLDGRCLWDVCPSIPESTRVQMLDGSDPVQEVEVGDSWYRLKFTHASGSDTIFVFGTDITDQAVARKELEDRARFPAMNPGAVARLSADGTVIRANPAARALFERDTLVGLSWMDLCPGMDEALWERVRATERPVQHEADFGAVSISFTLRHEPIADQVFVYGSDITELKAAERALAELARFPDMNPGPVCRLDREGVVLLANPAASQVFGCEDLAGKRWLDLVPGLDEAFWQSVVNASGPAAVEARIGNREFVLTHAPGPEGLFVFVYGSDVTREKEAERALRQTEKMATLGTLAAGVAHELNNPAAAAQRAAEQLEHTFAQLESARAAMISGGVSLSEELVLRLDRQAREAAACPCLLEPLERTDRESEVEEWLESRGADEPWDAASALVEGGIGVAELEELKAEIGPQEAALVAAFQAHSLRVYRLLSEIRNGAGRLSEIVGAMKAYSYLGNAPVQSVDVNEGLRNTLVILRSKLKVGITVEEDLAPDLPRIQAYGGELNQVWTNLIDNAVDAMEGRGELRLRTRASDGRVIVEVEDNGPGIAPEDQRRLFDAFFTTKEPGKGTGLGLNTSYNIVVQKHRGSIWVDSEPGRTRFTVELPLSGALRDEEEHLPRAKKGGLDGTA